MMNQVPWLKSPARCALLGLLLLALCALACGGPDGVPKGQKRGACGHLMSARDEHPKCQPCRVRQGLCSGPEFPCSVCVGWTQVQWDALSARRSSASRRSSLSSSASNPGLDLTDTPSVAPDHVPGRTDAAAQFTPVVLPVDQSVAPPGDRQPCEVPDPAGDWTHKSVNDKAVRKQLRAARRKELDRQRSCGTGTSSLASDTVHGAADNTGTGAPGTGQSAVPSDRSQVPHASSSTGHTGPPVKKSKVKKSKAGKSKTPSSGSKKKATSATTRSKEATSLHTGGRQTPPPGVDVPPVRGSEDLAGDHVVSPPMPQLSPADIDRSNRLREQSRDTGTPLVSSGHPQPVRCQVSDHLWGGIGAELGALAGLSQLEGDLFSDDDQPGSDLNLPENPPITGRPDTGSGHGRSALSSHVAPVRPTEAVPVRAQVDSHVHRDTQQPVVPDRDRSRSGPGGSSEEDLYSRLESSMRSMLSTMLPGLIATAVATQSGASQGSGSSSTAPSREPRVVPPESESGEDDYEDEADLAPAGGHVEEGEVSSSSEEPEVEPPPSARQVCQAACGVLPSDLVRTSSYEQPLRAACMVDETAQAPTVRQSFEITGLVSTALALVQNYLLGIPVNAHSHRDAAAMCEQAWSELQGPQPGGLPASAGRFMSKDQPRVRGVPTLSSTHLDHPLRNPLRLEGDLWAGVSGSGLHATIPFSVLGELESLVREILVRLSGVDSFLTAVRARGVDATRDSVQYWTEGITSLCAASLQSAKLLANLVLIRRDAVLQSVPGFRSFSRTTLSALRTAPIDRSSLFGGLFHRAVEHENKNAALLAFGTAAGGQSGAPGTSRKRRTSRKGRGGAPPAKRPKTGHPAPPSRPAPAAAPRPTPPAREEPARRDRPVGRGTGGQRKRGSFSRGGRGGPSK